MARGVFRSLDLGQGRIQEQCRDFCGLPPQATNRPKIYVFFFTNFPLFLTISPSLPYFTIFTQKNLRGGGESICPKLGGGARAFIAPGYAPDFGITKRKLILDPDYIDLMYYIHMFSTILVPIV